MKIAASILAAVAAAGAVDVANLHSAFLKHCMQYNLNFSSFQEYKYRLEQYAQTDAAIQELNAIEGSLATFAHNHLSTLTQEERAKLNGFINNNSSANSDSSNNDPQPVSNQWWAPPPPPVQGTATYTKNWVTEGAVTSVKNQGQCGSCWTFSTCGALESANYIKTGVLENLSEQQLVDCDTTNYGCNGGNLNAAVRYTESNPVELYSDYQYTSGYTQTAGKCKYNKSKGKVAATGYTDVAPSNKTAMKNALDQQPLMVAIQANTMYFQQYQSGVLNSTRCGTSLDHAVLAVGYGTEAGTDFWLIKNSWGTSWGEAGYVKLAMTDTTGICGVQMQPVQPHV